MTTNATAETATSFQQKLDSVQAFVMGHVKNSNTFSLPYLHIELPVYLSMHALMVVLAATLLIVLFGIVYRKRDPVPTGITNLLEMFVVFVRDEISVRFLGEKDGIRMAPLFCSFFFFILTMNLIGLVPCFAAATGNLSVTAALALVTFGFMILGGIIKTGPIGFLKGFIPSGLPWPLAVFMFPIEVFGVLIKAGALMIRLFANMLSGHMVLFFMLGMICIFGLYALPVIALGVLVYIIELFVAFLQAYVFTLLSAIFIGQRYHPEH